jgi:heme o synthase
VHQQQEDRGYMTRTGRFARFAWSVLAYNVAVILWGVYVRATGSGAGCGAHWPLCDGVVMPLPKSVALVVEFTHRVSSGIVLPLVVGVLIGAFRLFPSGHAARRAAQFALLFTITEALVGAALVKFGLVNHNASAARAVVMAIHLLNTFALLAALTLTAWWSSGGRPLRLRGQGAVGWALGLALFGCVLMAVSGALTALGDTLFPVRDHVDAVRQGLTATGHFLERLRALHPMIAVSVGMYLIAVAALVFRLRPDAVVQRFAHALGLLFFTQVCLGFINILLMAPVWMQMIHLLAADLVWVCLVLLTASALAEGVRHVDMAGVEVTDVPPEPRSSLQRATWRDYLALTKPRVISLLLFTTLTAMVVAAGGWPGTGLMVMVAIGGYMAAGAANAINMVIDWDIDGRMHRTANRPTVTRTISVANALLFALALAVGATTILWWAANLLTAMLAMAGLAFYVVVYTVLLKRRTWHNIVIGGAAGAFPPLVGCAAVTGHLSVLAWLLFAIVFFWTPVHFWALALLLKDDYAAAGVPMLPVALGERATVIQIALYAVATAMISLVPWVEREVGGVYLVGAVMLNAALLARSLSLYRTPQRHEAFVLFKYSMVYLALLFLVMAVDRSMG